MQQQLDSSKRTLNFYDRNFIFEKKEEFTATEFRTKNKYFCQAKKKCTATNRMVSVTN